MATPRRFSAVPTTSSSPMVSHLPRPHSAQSNHGRLHSGGPSESSSADSSDQRNVRVVIRVRPSLSDDTVPPRYRSVLVHPTSASDLRIDVDPATLAGQTGVSSGIKRHPTFAFDHVLGEEANQLDLYDVTGKETVDEFLKGHNVTFLAYGQTSSGKSYSMGTTGEETDYSGTDFTPRTGLIPRVVRSIFDRAEDCRVSSGSGSSWECRISFLELYNEEIIDLLSGAGVQIQIREERDGRIIWSGVREVKVRTLEEVMQLLQDGSTRRKTGETGMNATSSRSHAIFSLTLVQKRRSVSSSQADRPQSPPGTPRLKRPTSFAALPPRSTTPSGARGGPPVAFTQKASGIPRPNSMLGHRDDDFVIITSKFNMVDLAGSERLKRTAAQGERMREGISINSGLSALGNVISALSESGKAKAHIPYRDSKLTRMLQDSIGGNALTTMIACISPFEYNIAETLNTIKYASRARNIKNTARINAVEAGWDDVEHLQNTVIKLRKQIAGIEADGGVIHTGTEGKGMGKDAQKHSEKLVQRLAELQKEHTELYDKYLAKCNENMRLSTELRNATPGDADVLERFNETVEPVILEYEKVVSALTVQLDDLRAQLSLMDTLYEEQGRGLVEAQERYALSEGYVSELRTRSGKLSERNAASETYIVDLETKLKTLTEADSARTEAAAELRKEITKLKEENALLTRHASEVETRLTVSDSQSSRSLDQVHKLEKEIEKQTAAYKDLESHLSLLDTTADNKALLEEIDVRNKRIAELEMHLIDMAETRQAKKELEEALEAERASQEELRQQLGQRPDSVIASHSRLLSSEPSSSLRSGSSPTPASDEAGHSSKGSSSDEELDGLRTQLAEMSTRVAEAESRYSAAEARVAELQALLVEMKEVDDVMPITPSVSITNLDEASETGSSSLHTPKDISPAPSPSRANRRSVPILSSTGFTQKGGGGFRSGRGYGENRRSRPQSLSQELSSAQQSLTSPRGSWGPNSLLFGASPTPQSLPATKPLRTQQSVESELKFVHGVVEERDEELRQKEIYIRQLESQLSLLPTTSSSLSIDTTATHMGPSRKTSASSLLTATNPSTIPLPITPQNPGIGLPSDPSVESLDQPDTPLSSTEGVEFGFIPSPSGDMSAEIMREVELKEASQRQIIDQQFRQIADLQKNNHKLRTELVGGYPEIYRTVQSLQKERDELSEKMRAMPVPTSPTHINHIREEHAQELQALISGHAESVEMLRKDCDTSIARLEAQLAASGEAHAAELRELKAHEMRLQEELRAQDEAHKRSKHDADALNADLNASILASDEDRRQLKMKADQALFELSRVRDQYQLERNGSLKQIAELVAAKETLEKAVAELESSKSELSKRNGELEREQRFSRKILPPPQGPPPNLPLPPLPSPAGSSAGGATPVPMARTVSDRGSASGSQQEHEKRDSGTSGGHGTTGIGSLSHAADIDAAVPLLPSNIGLMVQKVLSERDMAISERTALRRQLQDRLTTVQDAEQQLTEQVERSQTLTRELAEARKTSSKLRAHLEDSRQESRRQAEECKTHMSELEARRSQMDSLEDGKRRERESLAMANAQVATLKAQLEKAMDVKVNKKMGNRLKCF